MRLTMLTAMLALVLGGGACRSAKKPTTELNAAESVRRYEWRGSLFTPSELAGAMQVRGTGTWAREGDNASLVTVTVSNATPGGIHPWHVHRGRCGDNGPIVGDAAAYKPLAVDGNGNASSTARLNVTLPDSGNYYVNVHALATNMGTIISCGNLAPPVS
jgi:hypothetical protein